MLVVLWLKAVPSKGQGKTIWRSVAQVPPVRCSRFEVTFSDSVRWMLCASCGAGGVTIEGNDRFPK